MHIEEEMFIGTRPATLLQIFYEFLLYYEVIIKRALDADDNCQASTLTQTVTGPVGPVTPRIYWSSKDFTGPTIFYYKYQIFTIMY